MWLWNDSIHGTYKLAGRSIDEAVEWLLMDDSFCNTRRYRSFATVGWHLRFNSDRSFHLLPSSLSKEDIPHGRLHFCFLNKHSYWEQRYTAVLTV
jgi:hypothetical protein